jgi:hypothetical protein
MDNKNSTKASEGGSENTRGKQDLLVSGGTGLGFSKVEGLNQEKSINYRSGDLGETPSQDKDELTAKEEKTDKIIHQILSDQREKK